MKYSNRSVVVAMLLFANAAAAGSAIINELFFDPIGDFDTDSNSEFLEIRSTTGGAFDLDGIWFIQLDATVEGNSGVVRSALDLTGLHTGENGLLLVRDVSTLDQTSLLPRPASSTVVHRELNPFGQHGLIDGEVTVLLVSDFIGTVGLDLDQDDDGTFDSGLPWKDIVDSYGKSSRGARYTGRNDDFGNRVVPNQAFIRLSQGGATVETVSIGPGPFDIFFDREPGPMFFQGNVLGDEIISMAQLTPGRNNDYIKNLLVDCNRDETTNLEDLECGCRVGAMEEILFELDLKGGDLDGDRNVDFSDFLTLSQNFGDDVNMYSQGDIDCNGKVDFADFLTLSRNFSSNAERVAVPETGISIPFPIVIMCLLHALGKRRAKKDGTVGMPAAVGRGN